MKIKIILMILIVSCSRVSKPRLEDPAWSKPWFNYESKSVNSLDTFFWAISAKSFPINQWKNYSVIGVDGFDAKKSDMTSFRDSGKKLVCYLSAHYESWRDDADSWSGKILGRDLGNWNGELIVDVTRWDKLKPIFEKRFLMCKNKGFHFVEIDNVDQIPEGRSLLDVTQYVERLVALAGKFGLPVFLKNFGLHVKQFEPLTAGAIVESCNVYNECHIYKPFHDKGKPVFKIEYEKKNCKPDSWGKTYYANKILNGSKWKECL